MDASEFVTDLLKGRNALPPGTRRKHGGIWKIKQGDGTWQRDPDQKSRKKKGKAATKKKDRGRPATKVGTVVTRANGAQYKKTADGWDYLGMKVNKQHERAVARIARQKAEKRAKARAKAVKERAKAKESADKRAESARNRAEATEARRVAREAKEAADKVARVADRTVAAPAAAKPKDEKYEAWMKREGRFSRQTPRNLPEFDDDDFGPALDDLDGPSFSALIREHVPPVSRPSVRLRKKKDRKERPPVTKAERFVADEIAKAGQRRISVPTRDEKVTVQPAKRKRKRFPFTGYIEFQGLKIDVENRKGSTRKGTDKDGKPWSIKMTHHYGEIRGTKAVDGDPLDVYVGPSAASPLVVVIHQSDPVTKKYDEDKVMLGFGSKADAIKAYRAQYNRRGFYGGCTTVSIGNFWKWLSDKGKSQVQFKSFTALTASIQKGIGAPAGYGPIPGSKHGGYRKKVGGHWDYWYPDGKTAKKAQKHRAKQSSKTRKKLGKLLRQGGDTTNAKHQAAIDAALDDHEDALMHAHHAANADKVQSTHGDGKTTETAGEKEDDFSGDIPKDPEEIRARSQNIAAAIEATDDEKMKQGLALQLYNHQRALQAAQASAPEPAKESAKKKEEPAAAEQAPEQVKVDPESGKTELVEQTEGPGPQRNESPEEEEQRETLMAMSDLGVKRAEAAQRAEAERTGKMTVAVPGQYQKTVDKLDAEIADKREEFVAMTERHKAEKKAARKDKRRRKRQAEAAKQTPEAKWGFDPEATMVPAETAKAAETAVDRLRQDYPDLHRELAQAARKLTTALAASNAKWTEHGFEAVTAATDAYNRVAGRHEGIGAAQDTRVGLAIRDRIARDAESVNKAAAAFVRGLLCK